MGRNICFMQISNRQIDSIFRAVSTQLRADKAEQAKKGGNIARSGDSATISDKAAELNKFKEILAQMPDVRQDKLADLAERINSGQYKPPSDKVAEKMLLRGLADSLE
jgi:negative regulator of flagellin synthesis FlgM